MTTLTTPVDTTSGVVANLKHWASSPFSTTMPLYDWFLWTGVVIVMVIAWMFIVHDLEHLV